MFVILCNTLLATKYYVKTSGNDSNTGLSDAQAFAHHPWMTTFTRASAAPHTTTLSFLSVKVSTTPTYFTSNANILELYAIGKSMTQAKFNTFQTIMNTLFNSY